MGVAADVRDFAAVGRAFETACAQFGTIDVLVSGAAGNFLAPAGTHARLSAACANAH